jgi:hypothetical protein
MVQKLKQSSLGFCPHIEQKHRENMRLWPYHARRERQLKFVAARWRKRLELDFQSLLGSPPVVGACGDGD